ncbi:uncharacterized protein CLAFUR5_09120 [Fulvia fulva]|uniref:Uncharacterized protein n=1 Tax=Passalora fulva TaxID=5499 RepID=A0A9Q8UT57_PASFU|nr:uncharacterized protein CLAFUR5_09120 [Fulvia fulva]UJO21521.1 hypothetical protein CLAFUR5_09120 [Fulvia fulva]
MCRRTIIIASCGHDLGWVLVQCQEFRDRNEAHAHCDDLYIRGAQYIFLNGPCGRCVQEAHRIADGSVSGEEDEHGLEDDDGDSNSNSVTAVEDNGCANRQESDGRARGVNRRAHNQSTSDENEDCGASAWDTYRYAPRGLSPVPEGAEPTEASTAASIRSDSSASQRQRTAAIIDLERRRVLRTVRARRRFREQDIEDTPTIASYHASLRGGGGKDDANDDEIPREVLEESTRAYQHQMRNWVDESRNLHQSQGTDDEEEQIRQALEASMQEQEAALNAQVDADVQQTLRNTAQNQPTSIPQQGAEIQRLLAQSAQDADRAFERQYNQALEETLRLSLQEHPIQSEDDFDDEVAKATALSAGEYRDRYGPYMPSNWKEQYDDFARKGIESSRASSSRSGGGVLVPGHNEDEMWTQRGAGYGREGARSSVGEDYVAIPTGAGGGAASAPVPPRPQSQPIETPTVGEPSPANPCPPIPATTASTIAASERQRQPAPVPSHPSQTQSRPIERPALTRAGPRGPQPLGGSRTPNLYRQHPDDAAVAAREAALRRYRQPAAAPERKPSEEKPKTDTEEELVGWWKGEARKS